MHNRDSKRRYPAIDKDRVFIFIYRDDFDLIDAYVEYLRIIKDRPFTLDDRIAIFKLYPDKDPLRLIYFLRIVEANIIHLDGVLNNRGIHAWNYEVTYIPNSVEIVVEEI